MNDLTRAMERLAEAIGIPVLSGGAVVVDAARGRIAEMKAAYDGQKQFIAKQASMVRALQRRLNAAGLNSSIPGQAERDAADRELME